MDRLKIQATFDEVFDQAVLYHGFTDYMRDCPQSPLWPTKKITSGVSFRYPTTYVPCQRP